MAQVDNTRWLARYDSLKEFVERNDALPTKDDDKSLAVFVANEKAKYKKGVLSDFRVQKLEEIPGWSWGVFRSMEEGLTDILKFFEVHKRAPGYNDKNEKGTRFEYVIRRAKNNRAELGEDIEKKLSDMPGWEWDVQQKNESLTIPAFMELVKRFHEKNPRPLKQKGEFFEGHNIGFKADRYRVKFKDQRDHPDAVLLSSLPYWWWTGQEKEKMKL